MKLTIQRIWQQTIEVTRQKHASVAKYDNVRVNTWRGSNPKWEWRTTMCILVQKEIFKIQECIKEPYSGLDGQGMVYNDKPRYYWDALTWVGTMY